VLAGCGGSSGVSTSAEDPRLLVAALGDSITSGSPGYDPDPVARANFGFGDDQRSSYEYWAEQKAPGLVFRNCGAFGERTDEIAARFDDCTQGAEALIVQGGINDIAQGRPVEAAAANLREIVKHGGAFGIPVAIAELLPWSNGFPRAEAPIRALNLSIAEIGREERVAVLPFHHALEDPARPGRMRADLTADGDHPSVEGYRLLGALVAAGLPKPASSP
jgi:lysophospholipase L1-like esterase